MFHPSSGAWVNAAQPARNTAVYQLKAALAIGFQASGRQTRMRVGAQDPPWRVIRAFPLTNGGALAHLHNVSGGVLAGDHLSLHVDVGPHAIAQVTSTGATRLYRRRPGAPESEQRVSVEIATGGLLEYLPDPLIPFAGSRHRQVTHVSMAEGSTLFWWEVLTPGRQAMGEQFAFESLEVSTTVQAPVRPVVLENFRLQPGLRSLRSNARLGGHSHSVSFYAIQVGRSYSSLCELEGKLGEIAKVESRAGTIWGASALASDGVVVRGLSDTARHLPATLFRFWTTARRFLTGEDAVFPRKLK